MSPLERAEKGRIKEGGGREGQRRDREAYLGGVRGAE
jgi:hypothetical protein